MLEWRFVPSDHEMPQAWLEYNTGGVNWVPEKDNAVKIRLSWNDNIAPSKVRFTLFDISSEPGFSMNSRDRNTDPDLEFEAGIREKGYRISQSSGNYVATKENPEGNSEVITLHARDYGAYASLKAEVLVNGNWFTAEARPFETYSLPVPYDENGNNIADRWEKDTGVYDKSLPPDWDEDPVPAGQKGNGDGFTLYEEYRGFQANQHYFTKGAHEQVEGKHVRLDPMRKDIFAYDPDSLLRNYYFPNGNPADLNWHLIDLTMIKKDGALEKSPDYRWVNFNTSGEYSARHQYAIFVLDKGEDYDVDWKTRKVNRWAGTTKSLCGKNDLFTPPLKCFYSAEIYSKNVQEFVYNPDHNFHRPKNVVFHDLLATTVIHELGHALGIKHHKPKTYQGVQDCAMRYEEVMEYKHANVIELLKARYCKANEYYLTGEADASGHFTRHPSHNCYGQINIKGN